jgi:hypothetical protein
MDIFEAHLIELVDLLNYTKEHILNVFTGTS